MNAPVHIGDLVTVDEAGEAINSKTTSLPGEFVLDEGQDSEQGEGNPDLGDPMAAEEVIAALSIYEVITYDLTSNTFRLKCVFRPIVTGRFGTS